MQIVIVDERDASAVDRVDGVPVNLLQVAFPGIVGRMRFSGEDNLDVAAKVMGQTVIGRIEIMADHVVVHVNLPWAFAMFAGKVQGEIEQRGRRLLEKK